MKTFNFILHVGACVLFAISPIIEMPYEFAIFVELLAIYNNTKYK